MPPVPHPILELTGVSKRFGAVQALSDVALRIDAGEVVASPLKSVNCYSKSAHAARMISSIHGKCWSVKSLC